MKATASLVWSDIRLLLANDCEICVSFLPQTSLSRATNNTFSAATAWLAGWLAGAAQLSLQLTARQRREWGKEKCSHHAPHIVVVLLLLHHSLTWSLVVSFHAINLMRKSVARIHVSDELRRKYYELISLLQALLAYQAHLLNHSHIHLLGLFASLRSSVDKYLPFATGWLTKYYQANYPHTHHTIIDYKL